MIHAQGSLKTSTMSNLQKQNNGSRIFTSAFAPIIGESAQIKEVIASAAKMIQREWRTIFIQGERGTGKELLARAIHTRSFQGFRPFVMVECAELDEKMVENVFFGDDGNENCNGVFEKAQDGTIFINEVFSLPIEIQQKLATVIEQRKYKSLNSDVLKKFDARVIFTDSNSIKKSGEVSQTLHYCLNAVRLFLPPLRDRIEDVDLLANHFLKRYADEFQSPARNFTVEAFNLLKKHTWVGNVRELRHVIERAVLLSEKRYITDILLKEAISAQNEDVPQPIYNQKVIAVPPEGMSLQEVEKHLIKLVLQQNNWNKRRTARILKISRPRLDRKIEKYSICKNDQLMTVD